MTLNEKQRHLKDRFCDLRGYWDEEWQSLLQVNPTYFESFLDLRETCQSRNRLSPKVQEFIFLAVASCTTHIYHPAIKAHINAALEAGASKGEVAEVVGLTYLVGVHTITLGAPLLLELMRELEIPLNDSEAMKGRRQQAKENFIAKRGFWVDSWNPILDLDVDFFESYTEFSSLPYRTGLLEPKIRELVICAFDVSTHHLHARGTKNHMKNCLEFGGTPEEIMEMLEIVSLAGIHGVTATAPLLTALV